MAIIIADVRSQRGDNTRSSKVADFSRGRTSNGRQATEHVFLGCRSRLLSQSPLRCFFFFCVCVCVFFCWGRGLRDQKDGFNQIA